LQQHRKDPAMGTIAIPEDVRRRWLPHATPAGLYALAGGLAPWGWAIAAASAVAGLALGLVAAPVDVEQGDALRILIVHVPAAWMSLLIYLAMAFWSGLGLVLASALPAMVARALAPTGALMTFLALWTGALWGKPTWGAWWVWDARLTSELLLLCLYLGFIALQAANDDPRRGDRAGAVFSLVGVINVPIVYFCARWWNTVHRPMIGTSSWADTSTLMLWGLLLMAAAFSAWCFAAIALRLRAIILERERGNAWVLQLTEARAAVGEPE
jgi:heme exporter protein C